MRSVRSEQLRPTIRWLHPYTLADADRDAYAVLLFLGACLFGYIVARLAA